MTEESPVQPRGRDAIPRDELLELIEDWRQEANEMEPYGGTKRRVVAHQLRKRAGELEALLQE